MDWERGKAAPCVYIKDVAADISDQEIEIDCYMDSQKTRSRGSDNEVSHLQGRAVNVVSIKLEPLRADNTRYISTATAATPELFFDHVPI